MVNTNMRDAHNRLTTYAFACGYLEKHETEACRINISMPSPSAGFYQVFYWKLDEGSQGRQWLNFKNRIKAYQLYRKLVREAGK
jgi:hypothetical protein